MKVSVITIISQTNYGAVLQAVATCTYIQSLGHEAELVDYTPEYNAINPMQFCYRKAWMSLIRHKRKWLREFLTSHVRITSASYTSYLQLENNPPVANIYLVGSDQVWNDELYNDRLSPAFFLRFISGKKKMSYASSIGKDTISSEDLHKMKEYLADFSAISVREESARQMLRSTGIDHVVQTVDPVLLLDKEYYDHIAKPIINGKYLLIYGVEANEDMNTIAKAIASRRGWPVVEIGFALKRFDSDFFMRNLRAEEFLGLIQGAEYVVTSSFHGTAFSLIFQKNFLSVAPSKRKNRLESILDIAGLKNRLVENRNDCVFDSVIQAIDYTHPAIRLQKAIAESQQYLSRALAKS